ncbi:unnamed protein product, partial [marine sediment metagenome]
RLYHAGDSPTLTASASAARTGDVVYIPMADQLGERAIVIDGATTGTAHEGTVDISSTGNMVRYATMLYLHNDSGVTIAGATDGFLLDVQDTSVAVATSYAVEIGSVYNEALKVTEGDVLIADTLTVTAKILGSGEVEVDTTLNVDGVIDFDGTTVDFDSATANFFDITSAIASASTACRIYSSPAVLSGQQYLLALDYGDDGDANGDYIIARDNAGADEKFRLGQNGDITMSVGTLTMTSGHISVDHGADIAS